MKTKHRNVSEDIAKAVFIICGIMAILAVCSITVYMIAKGAPALGEVGVFKLLFGTEWKPTAEDPSFGILYIILSSIVGTSLSVLIGVPVGLLTAVFLTEISNKKLAAIVGPAVELLAAIPSVIYGLLGLMLLNPAMYKLERIIFAGSKTHQFTGGSNLLSAIIVLAIMILPTVINVSASSIRAVGQDLRAASLALGASKIQTIFKVTIPAAKSGILTGVVLGIGRALGEAMAINMVAGGAVNIPLPFNSVRFLTTQLVSEMGYAEGTHRQVLFTVGLVLYIFIMAINLILMKVRRSSDDSLENERRKDAAKAARKNKEQGNAAAFKAEQSKATATLMEGGQ
ncbi:MAG: phosphate ABC transporter permease subunit PstC [Eubacteriales bacterium]|nr:phosphate ABC transporter permease subunit PstC [Eubacteriales bacterium]